MAVEAIDAYAQFLTLKVKEKDYDATLISPTDIIDQVWHTHILDTQAYLECNHWLLKDKFIHHNPLGAMDQVARQERAITALEAYKRHFGEHAPQNLPFWTFDAYIRKDQNPITIQYYRESRSGLLFQDKQVVEILPMFGLNSKEGMVIYDVSKNLQLPLTTRASELNTNEPIRILDADDAARRALPAAQRRDSRILIRDMRKNLTQAFYVDLGPNGDFVFELKQIIQDKQGIPVNLIALIFCCQLLKDYDRLPEHEVKKEVNLRLVVKSRNC